MAELPVENRRSEQQSESQRSFVTRWKHKKLFDKGFIPVPSLFLRLYARLKPFPLSSGEALFVLHLMEFKWDAKAPFPGYGTLASRMGVSDKMVRRYAQSLQTKKYLHRKIRKGETNQFDLTPLFDALAKAADQEQKRAIKDSRKEKQQALLDWYGQLVDAYRVMSDEEREELKQWENANLGSGSLSSSDWPGWERYIGKRPKQ